MTTSDSAGPDEQPRVWLDGKVVIVAGPDNVIRFGSGSNVADEVRKHFPDAVELRPVSPSPAGLDEQRDTLMRLIAPVMGAWTIDSPYLDRAPREVADAVIAAGWRPVSRNGAGR